MLQSGFRLATLKGRGEGRVVRHWVRGLVWAAAPCGSTTTPHPPISLSLRTDTGAQGPHYKCGGQHHYNQEAIRMKVIAGMDVGKTSLDVSVSAGPVRRFENTPAGFAVLGAWLTRQGATEVVCEPTGGYERAAVRWLQRTGVSVHVAHPNRVRSFVRAARHQAKTDALDAQMLARYGAVFPMPRWLAKEADREELQDLLRRRKPLVQQRVQESQRLDKGLTEGATPPLSAISSGSTKRLHRWRKPTGRR